MSEITLRQSTQFVIRELKIISKISSYSEVDISGIFEEIDIFDSLLNPCMSGSILIRDAIGLSEKLLFDGSEVLKIKITKSEEEDIAIIDKRFRIYKQSNRQNLNMSSETYILHFISDEFIFSEQQVVSQAYNTNYSTIARQIMQNQLEISNVGLIEDSVGLKKLIIPNLKPIDAIEWCAKKAVDSKGSPNFVFFENKLGYNFATLSTLLSLPSIGTINFSPKNITPEIADEIWGARSVKVISQFDYIQKTRAGVYAGKFIGFDPVSRTVSELKVSFSDNYDIMTHGNKNKNLTVIENRAGELNTETYNAKKTLYHFSSNRSTIDYVKSNDAASLTNDNDTYRYILQRQAIFENLYSQRVQIVLPGNFNISSGLNVVLNIPKRSERANDESGEDQLDKSLFGKYLIVATRHIIKYDKHEVILEAVTDSTNKDAVYQSSNKQVIK
jgi:uncharacterized protein Smg (DUF494 family)